MKLFILTLIAYIALSFNISLAALPKGTEANKSYLCTIVDRKVEQFGVALVNDWVNQNVRDPKAKVAIKKCIRETKGY